MMMKGVVLAVVATVVVIVSNGIHGLVDITLLENLKFQSFCIFHCCLYFDKHRNPNRGKILRLRYRSHQLQKYIRTQEIRLHKSTSLKLLSSFLKGSLLTPSAKAKFSGWPHLSLHSRRAVPRQPRGPPWQPRQDAAYSGK